MSLNIESHLRTAVITKHQQKETKLVWHINRHPDYITKLVDGHSSIFLNDKMYIPTIFRKEIFKWYLTTLHHPGIATAESL
jgi:hypothetical protein